VEAMLNVDLYQLIIDLQQLVTLFYLLHWEVSRETVNDTLSQLLTSNFRDVQLLSPTLLYENSHNYQ
jgi:hypothetical protein